MSNLLIDVNDIARVSYTNPDIIYRMLAYQPVTESQAMAVLEALSMLTGRNYTIATLDIALLPTEETSEDGTQDGR